MNFTGIRVDVRGSSDIVVKLGIVSRALRQNGRADLVEPLFRDALMSAFESGDAMNAVRDYVDVVED